MEIAAGEFKAKCLKLIDRVADRHEEIVITKRGVPKAKLVAVSETRTAVFGCMKNTADIRGDIVAPIHEEWKADV